MVVLMHAFFIKYLKYIKYIKKLDSDLNSIPHISRVTKTAFFHLRNIAKVRSFLSRPEAEKLIHSYQVSWTTVMHSSLVLQKNL